MLCFKTTKMHKEIFLESMTLQTLIEQATSRYGKHTALSFVEGNPMSYEQLGVEINKIADLLHSYGIRKGDKVALFSHNMPNWVIAYFSVFAVGGVIVPVLPDFTTDEAKNVLEHSDAKLLFVSDKLYSKVKELTLPLLKTIVKVDDFSLISEIGSDYSADTRKQVKIAETDLAAIIYTSGTTGRSKGVVLTHKNIVHVVSEAYHLFPINTEDVFLSFLPLSHTYENSIGMLFPLMYGASIYYLEKPPTAASLLPALSKIRPTVMLSVPLIMEKIFKVQVQGKFAANPFANMIYKNALFRKLIHRIAGKKLYKTFGGRLKFFAIGGAKLDAKVERFLREANFPYGIGYGLTETAPLLAGCIPGQTKLQSTGKAIRGVELKIHEPNEAGVGEIWAKGPNVMQGYYKNPEASAEVLEDGWFRTGDFGKFDKHNRLYIKGRMKNTIIGSSGENIYPEDIESVINNNKYVLESLVVEEDGYLVAKIILDIENIEKTYEHIKSVMDEKKEQYHEMVSHLHKEINSQLNRISQINKIEVMDKPFEKTASQKIKRFLYSKNQKKAV